MRSHPSSWKNLFTKLGFKQEKKQSKSFDFHRRLHFEQCEDRRMLAVFIVDSPLDNTIADGVTTLREAINFANFDQVHDTIRFDSATMNGATILMDINLDEFDITESVTIEGMDPSGNVLDITIDGNDPDPDFNNTGIRIFDITSMAGLVTFDGLTLTGADVDGAIKGSELFNNSSIANSTFVFNRAPGEGGAIYAELQGGSLTIEDSTFHMNTADDSGGGIASSAFTPYVMAA